MGKKYFNDVLLIIFIGTVFTLFYINKRDIDFNIIILTVNMFCAVVGVVIVNVVIKLINKYGNK